MGCCISSQSNQGRSVTGGKPFKRNNIQWTSDIPITRTRLLEQRSTFWETAPFYEGRPEIWQAIQAAVTNDDVILAQSILDAANITLPTGNPNDGIYDELGNRYEVPLYCLVEPTNLLADDDTTGGNEIDLGQQSNTVEDDQPCELASSMTQRPLVKGHQKTISGVSSMDQQHPISIARKSTSSETLGNNTLPDISAIPGDHAIVVRLSTGKDLSIKISSTNETIPLLKSRIYADTNAHLTPDTHHLRLIHLGKILDDHTSIIADFTLTSTPPLDSNTVKLRAGAVIQALVVAIGS
ncbi:hypothetical protein BC941DRAFT_408568 [Chlamydoabsidia padenii]|nr:hypothetical protein BC941DRAFT_408568 [Chlamydoabsidia padenii]